MEKRIELLDHGYISLVEAYGSDERIIEAARMSTDKGFLGWGPLCGVSQADEYTCFEKCEPTDNISWYSCPVHGDVKPRSGDEKLLSYLYKNHHSTPFEFAGAIIEVQAPIFVFREWFRHRVQNFNEMSARYVPLPDVNYIPTLERLMMNSKTNKQAGTIKGSEKLTEEYARDYLHKLEDHYKEDQSLYEAALNMGITKELARVHIPVGRYSRMRAGANLRNWLGFLTLRQAPNAQWEIRQYADAMHTILSSTFPRTMALFDGK